MIDRNRLIRHSARLGCTFTGFIAHEHSGGTLAVIGRTVSAKGEHVKLLGMCINWKVVAGLMVVAAGLFVLVSPGMARTALPYLLSAVCPLSMLLMMKSMGGMNNAVAKEPSPTALSVTAVVQD